MLPEITPETMLQELPAIPEWFPKELEAIATYRGKPLFRIVNGQTETRFLNGNPQHIKHLLNACPYVVVTTRQFRRGYKASNTRFKYYATLSQAEEDRDKNLKSLKKSPIEVNVRQERRAVGRPCWVIEYYQPPEELPFEQWQALRYSYLPKNGIVQKIDKFGEYPSEGRYVYLMSVLGEDGKAIAPHRGIIDQLRAGYHERVSDTRTYEQLLRDDEEKTRKLEEQQLARLNSLFYDIQGVSAKKIRGTAISRPITKEYV